MVLGGGIWYRLFLLERGVLAVCGLWDEQVLLGLYSRSGGDLGKIQTTLSLLQLEVQE